jgi:hypothetical protein
MTAQFGSSNKLYHSASIALSNLGNYVYYVRCRDIAGNANPAAVKISFRYASANVVTAPAAQETAKNNQPPVISETPLSEKAGTSTVAITAVQAPGPVISNPSPSGVIYQKTVSLGIITDKPAECRYAADDRDFDSMDGQFFVADGQQQATVNLNEYGSYNYYVRCKDVSGNKDIVSQVISFEYQNLDPPPGENVTPPPAAALDCAKYTTAAADSVCDKFVDCVCDPDCPVAPDPGADPDCAKAAAGSQGKVGTSFPVFAVVSFILIAVAIVVVSIIIRKRKGDDGEEAEES